MELREQTGTISWKASSKCCFRVALTGAVICLFWLSSTGVRAQLPSASGDEAGWNPNYQAHDQWGCPANGQGGENWTQEDGSGQKPDDGGPKRCFPDTTRGIYAYSDQLNVSGMTEAQIRFAATHYVGGQKQTAAEAAELRAYNPNFLIMDYRLGEMLGYGQCDQNGNPTATNPTYIIDGTWTEEWPGDSTVEPNWFFYYNGSKVYACDQQHYLMNLDDPGWREFYSKQVIKELKDNGDDAVFADSYSVPDYWQDWNPELDYTTWIGSGPPNLETQWSKMIHDFTDYMRTRLRGRWLWIPNVGSWVTTRDTTDYTNVDGAMIEQFADYGNANFLAPADWVTQMDRAMSLVNLNKILIVQSYPGAWGGFNFERQEILASYLLIKGKHTYINLMASAGADPGGQTLQWWPDYNIDLGAPTEALPHDNDINKLWNPNWHVFERRYEKGIVLVNTTYNDTGVITLPHTYYMVVGDGGDTGAVVPADPSNWPTRNKLSYKAVNTIDLAGCNDGNGPPGSSYAFATPCAAILLNKLPSQTPDGQ